MNVIYNLLSCHLRVFLNFSIAFTTILNYSGITTTGKFRIPHKQCDACKASRPSRLNSGCNYVTGIAHTIMFYVIQNTRKSLSFSLCSPINVLSASGFCIQFKL